MPQATPIISDDTVAALTGDERWAEIGWLIRFEVAFGQLCHGDYAASAGLAAAAAAFALLDELLPDPTPGAVAITPQVEYERRATRIPLRRLGHEADATAASLYLLQRAGRGAACEMGTWK